MNNPLVSNFLKKSQKVFNPDTGGIRHPLPANRAEFLLNNDSLSVNELDRMIRSTRMVYISRVQRLVEGFLEHKREFGSLSEKAVYENLDWDPSRLFDRLFQKRCVCFLGWDDCWMLRDGTRGQLGFDFVGYDGKERPPIVIKDVLSYDEIAINALLGFSSFTRFFNSGGRYNNGVAGHPNSFVRDGVVVGMVGSRLDRLKVMECQHVLITKKQNTVKNGYGTDKTNRENSNNSCQITRGRHELLQLWAKFYNVSHFPLYDEVLLDSGNNENFIRLFDNDHTVGDDNQVFLNKEVYISRVSVMAETLLLEANKRASDEGLLAYVHIVGLGLGVWVANHKIQSKIYASTFLDVALKHINCGGLDHIGVLDFSYVSSVPGEEKALLEKYPDLPFKVLFSTRDPQKAGNDVSNKLLVVSYAWDGNAWPGNEFYFGNLTSSGDPAQASCSMISELHNPAILDSFEKTCFTSVV